MRPRAAALGGSNLLFFLESAGSEGRGVPRRAKLDSRADNQPEPRRKWDQRGAAAAPFAALLTEGNQVEKNYTQAFTSSQAPLVNASFAGGSELR